MIFSSFNFIIFFLALLAIYSTLKTVQQRASLLLAGSLIFYASWEPVYLILLGVSLYINYRIYLYLLTNSSRFILTVGIILNIGVLVFFKYMGMFFDTYLWLIPENNEQLMILRPAWVDWILPLGISFFTFQMLSALIDAYRGEWHRRVDFREWSLYVTYFPQLIAGPIVRARQLFDQLEALKPLNLDDVKIGTFIFIGGLIKKVVFADNLAPFVEQLYANPEQLDFIVSWLATIAFGLQIYLDFSGYSEMALGLAYIMGIKLPRNFLYPYISRNFSEFWTRWHITLSRWLRDYLYISLGGSRGTFKRTYLNLMITMLLGGLWHGASWSFMLWGGLHGLYLVMYHSLKYLYVSLGVTHKTELGRWLSLLGIPVTFVAVSYAWVFFRAESFESALVISSAMIGFSSTETVLSIRLYQLILLALTFVLVMSEPFIVTYFQRVGVSAWWKCVPFYIRGIAYTILILFITIFGGTTQKFIYFDF